jgi:hypothetical protein
MDMAFRFAVGEPDGPQSSSWKLWAQGDEAYLLVRQTIPAVVKFSFHKSGNCRWAEINPNKSGNERVISEWQRDAIPPAGLNRAALLISLLFPTDLLSTRGLNKQGKAFYIEPAPEGHALKLDIFLTRERGADVKSAFSSRNERTLLHVAPLRSLGNLCAASYILQCESVNLEVPGTPKLPGQVFGHLRFSSIDDAGTGRPVRMIVIGPAQPKESPTVWEVGGYQIPASPKVD